MRRAIHFLVLTLCVFLAGCAGTIQRDAGGGAQRIEGLTYKSVDIVMSDKAKGQLAESPQFSSKELGESVQRSLESAKLMRADGTHRVEVTVEGFNIRHLLAALVLSFLAGDDWIDAYVRVYDAQGKQLHAYKVNATYSFGGVTGSLDAIRMSLLYDKFSELTVGELTGKTEAGNVKPTAPPP